MSDEQPKGAPNGNGEPGHAMRPQSHGGSLKTGGDHARAGRPPNAIRADIRADFDAMREDLTKMFFDKRRTKVTVPDRIRIAELFGKYGFDESLNRTDVAAALQGTLEDIRSFLSPMISDEKILDLIGVIRPRWRGI